MSRAIAVSATLVLCVLADSRAALLDAQPSSALEGTWTARYATSGRSRGAERTSDTSRIHLQFSFDTSNMGHTWPVAALPGLNLDADADNITVVLRHDAGTVTLNGDVRRRRAFGIFDFTPNPEYERQIGAAVGRTALTPERLFALAVHDVSRSYVKELEALGYKNLDLDDLLAMRIHRVTPQFITELRQLGYAKLSHDDLVAGRIHGVSPEFIADLKKHGYSALDFDDLVSFRIHGVSPEFITALNTLGYRDLRSDRLVEFRIHGVTPDFVKEMSEAGYKDLPAERLVEFRIHGVDAEFVNDLKEQGYSGLTSAELVDARIHGRRWMRRRAKN